MIDKTWQYSKSQAKRGNRKAFDMTNPPRPAQGPQSNRKPSGNL